MRPKPSRCRRLAGAEEEGVGEEVGDLAWELGAGQGLELASWAKD